MSTKYIIIQKQDRTIEPWETKEVAIVFDGFIHHGNISVHLASKPIAAGFCTIEHGSKSPVVFCFGESETLKLKSRPQDIELVKEALGLL